MHMPLGDFSSKFKELFQSSELKDHREGKFLPFSTSPSLADMKKIEREILRFLLFRGTFLLEGSSTPEQLLYLASTVKRTGARVIGEIGFNAGFSSYAFLSAHPEAQLVSFDLGNHSYSKAAKTLIDKRFPTRHT